MSNLEQIRYICFIFLAFVIVYYFLYILSIYFKKKPEELSLVDFIKFLTISLGIFKISGVIYKVFSGGIEFVNLGIEILVLILIGAIFSYYIIINNIISIYKKTNLK